MHLIEHTGNQVEKKKNKSKKKAELMPVLFCGTKSALNHLYRIFLIFTIEIKFTRTISKNLIMPLSNWQHSVHMDLKWCLQYNHFKIMVHRFEWSLSNCSIWVFEWVCIEAMRIYEKDVMWFVLLQFLIVMQLKTLWLSCKKRANCELNKRKQKRK